MLRIMCSSVWAPELGGSSFLGLSASCHAKDQPKESLPAGHTSRVEPFRLVKAGSSLQVFAGASLFLMLRPDGAIRKQKRMREKLKP